MLAIQYSRQNGESIFQGKGLYLVAEVRLKGRHFATGMKLNGYEQEMWITGIGGALT